MGLLTVRTSRSLTPVPALETLPLLGCHVQLWCDSFLLHHITFYLVMFGCCLLEACSFLMRGRKEVGLERGEVVETGGGVGWREGKLKSGCTVWEKSLFSIKGRKRKFHCIHKEDYFSGINPAYNFMGKLLHSNKNRLLHYGERWKLIHCFWLKIDTATIEWLWMFLKSIKIDLQHPSISILGMKTKDSISY